MSANRLWNVAKNAASATKMPARSMTSSAVTFRMSPVSKCSSSSFPPATRLSMRITPAAATTNVMPMIASCGTGRFLLLRDQLKSAAAANVTLSEIQNEMRS